NRRSGWREEAQSGPAARGRPADHRFLSCTGRINTMTTMPDKRRADGAEAKEKIDGYLTRSGLASRSPRVVPLTGDASDRRYFRVLLPDSGTIVLSLHAVPFEFDKLPFVNVARLLAEMPVPIPAVLGHAADLGVL